MTTVFMMALKSLIKAKLIQRITELQNQNSYVNTAVRTLSLGIFGNNPSLSQAQMNSLIKFSDDLVLLGTKEPKDKLNNDKQNVDLISKAFEEQIAKVQGIRTNHEATDDGTTLACLKNLKEATEKFFKKNNEFLTVKDDDFSLSDLEFKNVPDHILYYNALCYLGTELFENHNTIEGTIRDEKEKSLKCRISGLYNNIKGMSKCDATTVAKQIALTEQAIEDILKDNQNVVLNKKHWTQKIPALSLGGIFALDFSRLLGASLGRLKYQMKNVLAEIKMITPKNYGLTEDMRINNLIGGTSAIFAPNIDKLGETDAKKFGVKTSDGSKANTADANVGAADKTKNDDVNSGAADETKNDADNVDDSANGAVSQPS